jgi:probable rRNA maturation factor
LKNWIQEVIRLNKHQTGHLSFVFCTDDYLLEVNKKFLNHDYYTDIITFDYSESNTVSGDLIISIDRVKENALTHQCSFNLELNRVIIHGVLHLLGFSDKTDDQISKMRELEGLYLAQYVEYQQ